MAQKLFAVKHNVWDADAWLNDRNTDPMNSRFYLYATREEAVKKAQSLDTSADIVNDCILYEGELSDAKILELTGFDDMDEWREALTEPYSTNWNETNFGETEKEKVAMAIIDDPDDDEIIECANYDHNKSIEGAIVVTWQWDRYIGYARTFLGLDTAGHDDTEAVLAKQDKVFVAQRDIVLTAEEVAQSADIAADLTAALLDRGSWKWRNPDAIRQAIEQKLY